MTSNSECDAFEKWWDSGLIPSEEIHPAMKAVALIAWQAATSHLMPAIKEARGALRELVHQCVACEREIDIHYGLGSDAGAGSSVPVCDANKALATLNAIIKE